jgi:glycosyltransferase involved in cell wall biosynthesis
MARFLREHGIHSDVFRISTQRTDTAPATPNFAELRFFRVDSVEEATPQLHTSQALVDFLIKQRYDRIVFKGMKYAVNRQIIEAVGDGARYGMIVGGSHRDPLFNRYGMVFVEHTGQLQDLKKIDGAKSIVSVLPKYLPDLDWSELRRREKYFDIVCNGKFVERKNQALLEPLFHSNLKIIFIGDGPLIMNIKGMASGCSNVHFSGAVPWREAVDVVASARLLVHPSLHEGLPRACVEAFACGVPMVGLRDTLGPALGGAGCCHLVEPRDFCSSVALLLHDVGRLSQMSREAVSYWKRNHNSEALEASMAIFADWIVATD